MSKISRLWWFVLLALPLSGALPAGLYVGHFSGAIAGDFIVALDGTDAAYVAGYIENIDEVFYGQTWLGFDNALSLYTDFGWANATVSATKLVGSAPGITFSAERVRPEGPHQARAGLFAGRFSGTFAGDAFAVVLPDGRIWFLSQSPSGMDGGRGFIGAEGQVNLRSFLGTLLTGSIDTNGGASGFWNGPGASGTWNVSLLVPLRDFLSLVPFTAEIIEDGWAWNGWLGWFTEVAYPWIYHLDHGWWWVASDESSSAWVYETVLGWCFIREGSYPWMYSAKRKEWLFFDSTVEAERWFYSPILSDWLKLPRAD